MPNAFLSQARHLHNRLIPLSMAMSVKADCLMRVRFREPFVLCRLRRPSGMPPEFEQWCKTSWLPANLGRDYYRCQAETHIQDLANKISRLQKEIEDRAGNLLDERDRMIQQRLWLQSELDNVGAG